jgi:ribulose-phosphate 3-epimerase
MVLKFLDRCDLILLMTVSPGFGGQNFLPKVLEKVAYTREMSRRLGLHLNIEVDGGINEESAKLCREKGANILVSGTHLYQAPNMKEAISNLRGSR